MSRARKTDEFEVEVAGEPYVWRIQRQPQWSSDLAERRGLALAVRHGQGQREAVLEFPVGKQPSFGVRQLQASTIPPDLVRTAIASAIAAGWEPLSRGKPITIAVDEAGG